MVHIRHFRGSLYAYSSGPGRTDHEAIRSPSYSFLIVKNGRKVLFDLGLRKAGSFLRAMLPV